MTDRRADRSGQLDIPLVWEQDHDGRDAVSEPPPQKPSRGPSQRPVGVWRLLAAALTDLGATLLVISATWATAALAGASMRPGQLVVTVAFGLGLAILLGGVVVWGWRGTFGMRLGSLAFAAPVPFGRAMRCWALWMLTSPLAGLPLLFGSRGHRGLERLAREPVTEC